MINKEVKTQQTTFIEKQGKEKFRGYTKAKSMRGWITGMISKYSRSGNIEWEFGFREVLNAYNHFHPEKALVTKITQWRGKSSLEILKEEDKIIVIKYQKPAKGEEAKEIIHTISKEELGAMIDSINYHKFRGKEEIKTRDLAFQYCINLNITKDDKKQEIFHGDFWKNIFAWRSMHNKITIILSALDEMGFIEYKGGKVRCKEQKISIQKIL